MPAQKQDTTFSEMLNRARVAPNVPRIVNEGILPQSNALDHASKLMRERQRLNDVATPVPRPLPVPTPVVEPPRAIPPAGFGSEFTQVAAVLSALLMEQRASNGISRETLERFNTSLRMSWMSTVGDSSQEPTSTVLPEGTTYNPNGGGGNDGGGGGAPFAGGYVPFFRNTRQYPIGVRFDGFFNTPGAGIKFSRSQSDASRFTSLSDAAGGQTQTGVVKLLPNEVVYAANIDPGVVVTNNDVFLVQVYDPRQFLEHQNYPGAPWKGA